MTNKRWLTVITVLIAVAVVAIGGIIYYGTAVLPGERLAADKTACQTLNDGLLNASSKAMVLAEKTPPASDAEVAKAYLDTADKAISDAYLKATSNGAVAAALGQISFSRLNAGADQSLTAVTNLVNSLDTVKTACAPFDPNATPSPTN